MTIEDLLRAVDTLTWDDLALLQRRIAERRQTALDAQDLMAKIGPFLQEAEPVTLRAGTMDVDKLREGVAGMWAGLSTADVEAIVAAMNDAVIASTEDTDE